MGGTPSIPPSFGRGLGPAPDMIRGDGSSAGQRPVSGLPFGPASLPGLAGYSNGLGQLGFDLYGRRRRRLPYRSARSGCRCNSGGCRGRRSCRRESSRSR